MDVAEWVQNIQKSLAAGQEVSFMVKIKPRGYSNTIKDVLLDNSTIKVSVSAPPLENRANIALIELLSKQLEIPKTHINIVRGFKSNFKTIHIHPGN